MKSFFTRIQGKFDAEYSGRYIATIMEEVANSNDIVLKALFNNQSGLKGCRLETEWRFDGLKKGRIADLVVLNNENNPLLLVEIKFRDHKSEANHAQLRDYLRYCKNNKNVQFLCLTAFHLKQEDETLLEKEQLMLFTDYASKLILANRKNDPVVSLLIEYFREQGLVMQNIDKVLLKKLMIKFFRNNKGAGKQQKNADMIEGIPNTLSALMKNMEIVSSEIQSLMGNVRSGSVSFEIHPKYIISNAFIEESKPINRSRKLIPKREQRDGGMLIIYSNCSINRSGDSKGNRDWLEIQFGFDLKIGKNSQDIKCSFYSSLRGKFNYNQEAPEFYKEKPIAISNIENREKSVVHYRKLIREVLNEAMDPDTLRELKINKTHKATLRSIQSRI